MLPTCGSCDHGLRFHDKCEHARFTVRHEVRVERGLVACHVRLIDKVYPAQPLDVDVSLPAWHNETQRISLLRSQGFAVLPIRHDDVIERFRKRQAAGKTRRVGTFGDQPARLGPWTHLIEQSLERYAGPLRATQQSVAHLRISAWLPELIARR